MKILVATQNKGKLREYQEILSDLKVEWLTLEEVGLGQMEVEETGTTFAENASLKAHAYRQASGLMTLADDSGLVVEALGGAPGVYSARYGAPDLTTDQQRYQRVLSQLAGIPDEQRTARFVCVIAIAPPQGAIQTVEGFLEGRVGYEARGTNGFGYDPIVVTADGRTVAELPSAEKHAISHRGNALRLAYPLLASLVE
jgi:XTP/dITP diphosphohydrolase